MGNTYLSRTPSSGGNRRTFTFSCWAKKVNTGAVRNTLFSAGTNSDNVDHFSINDDTILNIAFRSGGTTHSEVKAAGRRRDPASWYHLVMRIDTTQGTAADRVRFYVNGEETTYITTNYPSQDVQLEINDTKLHLVGAKRRDSIEHFFGGYLAEIHFADGQSLAPTVFGETDSTTGEWKPKTVSGVTYGTNGFYLKFANSGAMGTDSSGNNNTYTVNNAGSHPQVTDTPSNSFLTLNPLATGSRGTFSLGNTKVQLNLQGSVPYGQVEFGTFAVNKGKWYFEVKNLSAGGGGKMGLGISERWETNKYINGHNNIGSVGNALYSNQGDIKIGNGSDETASSYTDNDIIGVAFDLDNSKVYFHKNGSYQRSGDPANGTGGDTLTSSYDDYWTPWITKDSTNSAHNSSVEFNFGNPAFSISSENSDAAGFGRFEYAVPSGYYALCTRNLNTYG